MVDPKNTTQECSRCGTIVRKEPKDRIHECSCGLVLDRDENAAINILRRGLASVRKTDRNPLRKLGSSHKKKSTAKDTDDVRLVKQEHGEGCATGF